MTDTLHKWRTDGLYSTASSAKAYITNNIRGGILYGLYKLYPTITRNELIEAAKQESQYFEYMDEDHYLLEMNIGGHGSTLFQTALELRESLRPDLRTITSISKEDLEYELYCHPEFVCELSDITVFAPGALPITQDGNIIKEHFGDIDRLYKDRFRQNVESLGPHNFVFESNRLPYLQSQTNTLQCALSLVELSNNNYGHWIIEHLPKLRAAEYYEAETGIQPDIIVPSEAPGWMRQTLSAMGYEYMDLIHWDGDPIKVKSYLQPVYKPIRIFESEISPSNYRWVSETMKSRSSWQKFSNKFSDRVFLSREGHRREITNRDEIMDILRPLGFETYVPDQLSIPEQISLFSNANIVIGAHGSNMYNSIFCSDCHIVEILPTGFVNFALFEIMSVLGNNYSYLLGDLPVSDESTIELEDYTSKSDFTKHKHKDIHVNIEEFMSVLDELKL